MADDRASFMKSNTQLDKSNQLDDLAAVARGDNKSRIFDDDFEPKPHNHVLGSLNNQSQRSFTRHSPSPVPSSIGGRRRSQDTSNGSQPPRQQNSSPWQRGAGYE
ncbi:hypothetical protein NQ176_g9023 [Zarea fungicola]|uniref:Uncharacterized protein n=1 Tax=Zarea fungicola TaxID=93591 RepID=A0ACC1MQ11_9HYPO|nr:hypothetical protein NQ176_g9023 [Lecanicillium fungicola]